MLQSQRLAVYPVPFRGRCFAVPARNNFAAACIFFGETCPRTKRPQPADSDRITERETIG
jgi:hypothetical protein